jgi:hypothetical protein
MIMLFRFLQLANEKLGILVTPTGTMKLVKLLHPANEKSSITVKRELGEKVTLVKPLHPSKASPSIFDTLEGITMLFRLVLPANAAYPMLATLPSAGITLLLHPPITVLLSVWIKQFPSL